MEIQNFLPLLISATSMVSWGILGFLGAKISRTVGPSLGAFLIMLLALIMTILIWPAFYLIPDTINWQAFVLLGILGGGTFALYYKLIKTGKVSVIIPITAIWAIISSVLGLIFLNESANLLKIVCIFIVVSGIVILSMSWQEIKERKISLSSSEIAPALLVALGWGLYFFFLSPISRQSGWFFTTLLVRVFVTLTLFVLLFPQLKKKTITLSKIPWKILLFAAALDVLAFSSFNLALSKYEISYVSVVASAAPLITVILAAVFLKEKTDFVQKIGIALVIFGIIGLQLASI